MAKIKVTKTTIETIPEGVYDAEVTQIDEGDGNYGPYFKFTFEIIDGEYTGVSRIEIASKKLTKSPSGTESKLYSFVTALNGQEPDEGETIDTDRLIGKRCRILLKNTKEVDGIQYQNVKEVMPPK